MSPEQYEKIFDKMIVALRLALSRIGPIIEGVQDNWVVYETLLCHKNVLHVQIDLLLREKKNLKKHRYCR